MGDAHLAQGDGELDGTAIETSITGVVLSYSLCPSSLLLRAFPSQLTIRSVLSTFFLSFLHLRHHTCLAAMQFQITRIPKEYFEDVAPHLKVLSLARTKGKIRCPRAWQQQLEPPRPPPTPQTVGHLRSASPCFATRSAASSKNEEPTQDMLPLPLPLPLPHLARRQSSYRSSALTFSGSPSSVLSAASTVFRADCCGLARASAGVGMSGFTGQHASSKRSISSEQAPCSAMPDKALKKSKKAEPNAPCNGQFLPLGMMLRAMEQSKATSNPSRSITSARKQSKKHDA